MDYQEGADPQFQYRFADRQRRGVLLAVSIMLTLRVARRLDAQESRK